MKKTGIIAAPRATGQISCGAAYISGQRGLARPASSPNPPVTIKAVSGSAVRNTVVFPAKRTPARLARVNARTRSGGTKMRRNHGAGPPVDRAVQA